MIYRFLVEYKRRDIVFARMRHIVIYILISLISHLLLSCGNKDNAELKLVDEAIKNSPRYHSEALEFADSLSSIALKDTDAEKRFISEITASDAWAAIDLEKSLGLLKSADSISHFLTDENYRSFSLLKLASLYNSQGSMLEESYKIYNSLSPSEMPDSLKTRYFILGVQLHRAFAERAFDQTLKTQYYADASRLRDSVLKLQPGNVIIAVNKLIEENKLDDALKLLKDNKPSGMPFSRDYAPYYHYLAEIFRHKSMPDSQAHYLALSAVADLTNGVREYKALPQLAELLRHSDIERSYAYINASMNDAQASHSDLRQKEIAASFREIHAIYNEQQKQKSAIISFISIFLSILILIVISGLMSLRSKNRKLKVYASTIRDANIKLGDVNRQLKQLNIALARQSNIKQHYVRSFMELSLSYLKLMESFRAELAKIAAKGNWKLLTERINSSRYVNREVQDFYDNFDQAFTSIYPDFIDEINTLLKSECQIPNLAEGKLNTELRIYALIRLGISESNQIAKFLRCSESTVYNYRTKMRNRAINRTYFEHIFESMAEKIPD